MKVKLVILLVICLLAAVIGLPAAAQDSSKPKSGEIFIGSRQFAKGQMTGLQSGSDGLSMGPNEENGSYLSPILRAPLSFNAMVPHWLAQLPDDTSLVIKVRTKGKAEHWSDWYQLEHNDDWMLPGDIEMVGQMLTVPEGEGTHNWVQVQVTMARSQPVLHSGDDTPDDDGRAVLESLRFFFIDSTQGPTAEEMLAQQELLDSQAAGARQAGYPKPTVISRNVWCTYAECNYTAGIAYEPVTHLIVHHTVSANGDRDWAAVVRAIWYYHTHKDPPWRDIGYNYLVDMNGVIYEGHKGGDDVIGIHAAGANAGSMALAFIGTFTRPEEDPPGIAPPPAMLNAAADLFAWKADQKQINVYDASYLPNVSWGLPNLMGHRDVYGTTRCPGDLGHSILPWLRDEVARRINFVSPHLYIDEMSAAFKKSSTGNWLTAPYGCGFNGHAYYTWSTTEQASSTNWGEWQYSADACGQYEVEVYAPYCITGRRETSGAKYTITDSKGSRTVVANHDANVGTWMSLGLVDLAAGSAAKIRLTDLTGTDSGLGVWFDAVRIRPVSQIPLPRATNKSPSADSWSTKRSVTFNWNLSNENYLQAVILQVDDDPAFDSLVLSKEFSGAQTSYTTTFDRDFRRLYWRLVTRSTCGQYDLSSPTRFGIDTQPPSSRVQGIFLLDDGSYAVNWGGSDATSGIANYTVDYLAPGQTQWTRWFTRISATTKPFYPSTNGSYWFRVSATDHAGLVEPVSQSGDISTDNAIRLHRVIIFPLMAG